MTPDWIPDVETLLGRSLSIEDLEMGGRMAELGQTPEIIAEVLGQPLGPPPEERTFRFESVGGDAQPIP